ncbi:MAG: pilus assembly protein N-terminal domain-containing protein, partial [Rhodospirillaceae bacterium]
MARVAHRVAHRVARGLLYTLLVTGFAAPAPAQSPRPKPLATLAAALPSSAPLLPLAGKIEDESPGRAVTLTVTKVREFTLPVDVRDVVVGDPAVADVLIKTARLVYMVGNKVGDTNVIFLNAAGKQVLKLDIRVDRDLSALRATINELVPDADVKVMALNNDLIISGDVPSSRTSDSVRALVRRYVEKDENLVNMMRITGSQQVVIRLKVAEVRRQVTKRLGFNLFLQGSNFSIGSGSPTGANMFQDRFGTASSAGAKHMGLSTSGFNHNTTNTYGPNLTNSRAYTLTQAPYTYTSADTMANATTAVNSGTDVLTTAVTSGAATFPALAALSQTLATVEALEQQGLIKILAEPNLTAISGEPASFLAGGEYPVPSGRDPLGNVIITFRSFGVGLNFTPVVLASGLINLRIATEVSELNYDIQLRLADIAIPGLDIRRAQTTVEIPSGGSLVLGGLLRNNARNTVRGLPGLKDLPIIGALFRSTDFLSDETEMVVIATPYT